MNPQILILRTAGTNCDAETAHAFALAGGEPRFLHLNRLLENPRLLDQYQALALPGGFSYGDDIAAGKIFANQINHHLADAFRHFVDTGRPMIGICNGFQVLVKTSLLPGPLAERAGQTATLTNNDSHRFIDRWITLRSVSRKCIWTRQLGSTAPGAGSSPPHHANPQPLTSLLELPIAHGEGKFVPADEAVRQALWDKDQVALVYTQPDGAPAAGVFPHNPNGAVDDIAGICDASGLVFGLMPHPERYVTRLQHPAWSRRQFDRQPGQDLSGEGDGLAIFRNSVEYVRQALGSAA
jgi:phosphoribosylformylglycinamidine synthase